MMPLRRYFLFIAAAAAVTGAATCGASVKEDVNQGNVLYNKGDFTAASKSYENAVSKSGFSSAVNYNLGTALYRKGSFRKAIAQFNKAISLQDDRIIPSADYNIGNSYYRMTDKDAPGNEKKRMDHYESALKYYKRAMELDPLDKDAKFNYEFVSKRMNETHEFEKQDEQNKDKEKQDKDQKKEDQPQPGQGSDNQDKETGKGEEQEAGPESQGVGPGPQSEKKEEPSAKQDEPEREAEKKETEAQGGEENGEKAKGKDGTGPDSEMSGEKTSQSGDEKDGSEGLQVYQPPQSQEVAQEMSEQEARMLLEGYKGEEASGRTVKMRRKVLPLAEPVKDW